MDGVSENIGLVALIIISFMAISIAGQLIKSLHCRFRRSRVIQVKGVCHE